VPDVISSTDYYAFGSPMPGRSFNAGDYRAGMNGQYKDDEIFEGAYTAEYWQYDSRLGRRWNRDPKPTLGVSDYACFGNNPILFSDVNGDSISIARNIRFKVMTSLKVLYHTELGKNLIKYYINAPHDNINIYQFTQSDNEKNPSWAETGASENVSLNKNGKVKMNIDNSRSNEIGATAANFKHQDGDADNFIGLNNTDNRQNKLDKYDLAFILYHEAQAHIKGRTGEPSKEHYNFGNYAFGTGMQLWYYDKKLGQYQTAVRPGTDSWKAFKEILQIKVSDGKGTEKNKEDLNYMINYDKPKTK
jgi:RHS repeat-associated protein